MWFQWFSHESAASFSHECISCYLRNVYNTHQDTKSVPINRSVSTYLKSLSGGINRICPILLRTRVQMPAYHGTMVRLWQRHSIFLSLILIKEIENKRPASFIQPDANTRESLVEFESIYTYVNSHTLSNSPKLSLSLVFAWGYINTGVHFLCLK